MDRFSMEDRKNAAAIVRSPFQALCAVEAVHEFGIEAPVFYIQGNDKSAKMTRDFVASQGYAFQSLEDTRNSLDIIKKYRNYPKYKLMIVGDYFSQGQFTFAFLWVKHGGSIVYLDDGVATLSMLPPLNLRRGSDWGFSLRKVCERSFVGILALKRVKTLFFTIFDMEGKIPFDVVRNRFSMLNSSGAGEQKGCYIIGTWASVLGWTFEEYVEKLMPIVDFFKACYPGQAIFYCPHRHDENDDQQVADALGVTLFDTKVSVEVDFVSRNLYPKAVIGFGSTALYTLKKIYPETRVISIRFDQQHERGNVYVHGEDYKKSGIEIVDFDRLRALTAWDLRSD